MEAKSGPLAFISYSSKGKDFVQPLVSDLRANAINVWLDEEQIKVGESIAEKIANGLSKIYTLSLFSLITFGLHVGVQPS